MSSINGSLPPTQPLASASDPAPGQMQAQTSDPTSARASNLLPVSFTAPFFTRDVPMDLPPVNGTAQGKHYYSKEIYGNYRKFRASVDHARFRREFFEDLKFLGDFYANQSTPDSAMICQRLVQFYRHRFATDWFLGDDKPAAFFGKRLYVIDSQGKQSLDRICDRVRDGRIPIEKRTTAIHNLALGLDVCAPGVVSNLIAAEHALAMSASGIQAELQKAKEQVAEALIGQALYAGYASHSDYLTNEVHGVNAVYNYCADKLGLTPREDVYASFSDRSFLEACLDTVLRAMTPDRLARVIAEECLSMFATRLADRKRALSGDYSTPVQEDCEIILEDILMHYQLAPTAGLELSAFISIDIDGTHYRMRRDATLIARAFLRIMRVEGLLTEASVVVNHGEWTDSDGSRHALLTFGSNLVWRADWIDVPSDTSSQMTLSDTADWSLDTDAQQFTMRDLYVWWKACRSGGTMFPIVFPAGVLTAALRQAVDGVDPADLDDIPPIWLNDIENLFIVLPHMTDQAAGRCLWANLLYYKKHLSAAHRAELIDHAMGRSTAILELAKGSNAWALLSEQRGKLGGSRLHHWMVTDNGSAIDAVLQIVDGGRYWDKGTSANVNRDISAEGAAIYKALFGQPSKPMLNLAMAARNANAIAAWCRLVLAPGVINRLGKRLLGLLESKDARGSTALGRALANGHAQSMEPLYDLFTQPAVVAQIGKGMCRLLMAPVKADVPGLLAAMEDGHAEAVQVFHAMLTSGATLPYIESELFALIRARGRKTGFPGSKTASGTKGLVQAMKYGRERAIRAFHVMVVDPEILPRIAKRLSVLLTDKGRDGKGCLAVALEYGQFSAIREFHEMVADPLITPHIEHVLNEIVLAQTPEGKTGLAIALEKGYLRTIQAFHAFIVDEAIRPFIARSISQLCGVRQRGTLSLSLALKKNYAVTVKVYVDILTDPEIFPLVKHDLPRLIQRVLVDLEKLTDVSGRSKLLVTMRKNPAAALALTEFCRMVKRPEIAACLDEKIRESLQILEEHEPAAVVDTARTTADKTSARSAVFAPTRPRTSMMRRLVQHFTRRSQVAH